jgi:hypothetical protein
MVAIIKMISLNKLMVGGAAIFVQIRINHHIDRVGINDKIPLVRINLRV